MAMNNDRKPRWKKWRLMPEVRMFEAVALSLDIEPDKVRTTDYAWMGAKYPFDEGSEFNDRLDVLLANSTNRTFFPTPCISNLSNGYQCGIRLSEFAQWAVLVAEWNDLPPELVAMTKAPGQQSTAPEAQKRGAGEKAKPEWVTRARDIGTAWMLAEEKSTKKRPTVEQIARHLEGELSNQNITGARGTFLDWETIKREALTGITGREKGDNFRNATGNPHRK